MQVDRVLAALLPAPVEFRFQPQCTFPQVGPLAVLLELAFAVGVWQVARARRGLRIAAVLLAAHAAMNLALGLVNLMTPFAAMHTRGRRSQRPGAR